MSKSINYFEGNDVREKHEQKYLIFNPIPDRFNGNKIKLNKLPKVSFCIPTFNSSRTLKRCLHSIKIQNYPEIEIIIVDNGSADNTVDIAKEYTEHIYHDDGLLGSVRQKSLKHSNGEVVALFDSDIIIPHKDWLRNAVKYFNFSNNVSTVWPINLAPPNSPWTTRLYFNLWKVFMDHRIENEKSVFGGGNALFWKDYLDEIGGINKSFHWGEDFDWAKKLKNNGYQVIFIQEPLYHDTMNSLKEFSKKQFLASEAFTKEGFDLMGITKMDLIYENTVLGVKFMIKGLLYERDISWILLPIFIFIRGLGYCYSIIKNI